jgi:hypothetical protein
MPLRTSWCDLVTGGEATVVVAQDRISREPWHFGYLKAKLEEYRATPRTLDYEADDSPESEFFRDIRRGMAKMERSVTARRTFRLMAEEGYGIATVEKALEREGIPSPRGGRYWHNPVIRDLTLNDTCRPTRSRSWRRWPGGGNSRGRCWTTSIPRPLTASGGTAATPQKGPASSRRRAALGRAEEAAFLEAQLTEADTESAGYVRLAARGRITAEELDVHLADLEQRMAEATRELAGLRERREQLADIDRLADTVDEYLGELPQIIHGGQTSIGAEDRAERYRWAYGLLGLRVLDHKDDTLDVSGTFGERVLAPREPRSVELTPPGYATGVSSVSSDSQR